MLPVNEIFKTIQGEATFTGTPSVFIRLQGCPVWCNWCDTKFTWAKKKSKKVKQRDIINKIGQDERWAEFTIESLLDFAEFHCKIKHIVVTGGEPFIHDLEELTNKAIEKGLSIQIETSGTKPIKNIHKDTWITLSPKIDKAGGVKFDIKSLERANEIKYPILDEKDFINLQNIIKGYKNDIWLQPVEVNKDFKPSLKLCLKYCYEHNYKLSIQTHKLTGLK